MMKKWGRALAVVASVLALSYTVDAKPSMSHDGASHRLTRKGAFGRIAVQAGKDRQFPEGAEVSLSRTRANNVKARIKDGLKKRHHSGKTGGQRSRASATPSVLAMYDISIRHGGKKWQPAAGDPVRVDVELDEPVAVTAASTLGVVHLSDDGTVEELDSSRYGFTYNAGKTAVTAFWFSATGFSVYSIVDNSGDLKTPRRFYHFYDRPTAVPGSTTDEVQALPYRYTDSSNEVVNVQIIKDGDSLIEPPIPPDIVDVNSNLVSTFEGWYVVQTNAHTTMHGLDVSEGKLDSTSDPFVFVWPVGVTGNRLAFTNAISFAETETNDVDYWVVPLYEHSRFVQFYESAEEDMQNVENVHIVGRRLVALNDETHSMHIRVSDVTAPLRNSRGEYFSGWEYHRTAGGPKTQIMTYSAQGVAQEAFLEVDDALFEANRTEENGGHVVPMWPVYVEAHFLSFSPALPKGSGATYVGSLFVKSDTDIRSVEVSARPGYEFGGWWTGTNNGDDKIPDVTYGQQVTDANGAMIANLSSLTNHLGETIASTDANGKITLHADVTLYARWIPQPNATYRVIIWQQKVTDDKAAATKTYDYVTHYTSEMISSENSVTEAMLRSFSGTNSLKSRVSGLNVLSASAMADRAEVIATGMSFTGFETTAHWAVTNTEANGCVKSDNSTIVNVYFDRKLITLTFKVPVYQSATGTSGEQYGIYGETYFPIYFNNNKWYRTRTQGWFGYNYSNQYSGNRYVLSGWTDAPMTGLYGQTLEQNGYEWPTEYWWNAKDDGSGSRTTFLDAFMPPDLKDQTYYGIAPSQGDTTTINFYKEALDGSWVQANTVISSANASFSISDKYNGFTAYSFSVDGGSYNSVSDKHQSSGGDYYYNEGVTFNSSLDIRFARNEYEFIFRDSDTGENVFITNLLFEASFAGLDLSPTNKLINWKGRDTEHYTFEGWYEDASGTTEFDFANGKMGTATKVVFAVWKPVQYKVVIDPNGGQLEGDDSTWFYVDYNETVKEYTPTRDYRLDMDGAFYYSYHPWDPLGDKHVTPQNSPEYIPNISRRAYYTDNAAEATDTFNRYAYERGAYRFMGWYEVLPDGTVDTAPFAFGTRHNRPLVIRAIWQRSGLYTLKYESIDPAGEQATEVWFDPENGKGGYIDEGVTTLSKDPTNYDRDEYIWEGWQVIDPRQSNLPLTNIRSPGDVYIVHASHADSENVIHMRAVYSRRGSGTSRHIPDVVDLVLDSNDGAGLAAGFAVDPSLDGVGTYTDGTAGGFAGLNEGVWFAGRQNNFSVNLADYTPAFAHQNGYLLLGWDTNRISSTMIPAYYANETIGVDKSTAGENILYAVWEPQIYILFTNKTGVALNDITLNIPSWAHGEVFRVNSVEDTYHRQAFTAFHDGRATFSMEKDESICLVLPDGADKFFVVSGTNTWPVGTKLTATRGAAEYLDENNAPAVDGAMASTAFPSEEFVVTGTMRVNENPVTVSFEKFEYPTEINVPVRYFLHFTNTADGVVREITNDDGFWRSLNGLNRLTNITVRASDGDVDLSVRLRASATESVHEFLADIRPGTGNKLRENFKSTTIGIGSASAPPSAFPGSEYRSITKHETSGGSYVKFTRGELEWSRYSYIWNTYYDAAVYVVFYRREPVHVTVAKKVVGTASDSAKAFNFTADFAEHSKKVTYEVTTTHRKTQTQTRQYTRNMTFRERYATNSSYDNYWTVANLQNWDDIQNPERVGAPNTNNIAEVAADADKNLFSERGQEQVSLKDGDRHPFTIYYNALKDESEPYAPSGQTSNGPWGDYYSAGSGQNKKYYQDRTVTYTYTETITYTVIYQYETATITEAADDAFDLNAIAGDPSNPNVNHNGTPNLGARSYTISSLMETGRQYFYTYEPLDTAIFTNWRKTAPVTVTKTVQGAKAEDRDDTFDFAVTLADGEELNEAFLEAHPMPAGVTYGPAHKIFTFSLKDVVANGAANGSMTLALPLGAGYAVEEIYPGAKYVSTVPANASGTVPAAGVTVPFVNTRKVELGIAMNDLALEFNGALQHGYDISTVEGTGRDITETAYAVTGLKSGHVLTVLHHVPAQGTAVGSYRGHFENARITVARASDGEDVTGEYLVTTTPGSLTIDTAKLAVTITGNRETVTYNGVEQSVEGYTYAIIRKSDSARIGEDEVHPVIEPAYSKAKGTNAGTYYMTLLDGTAVSFVKSDGYEIAPADIHIVNGSLTITPAPATVTADDKSKIVGWPDPSFTATVTGLIGSDSVSYDFSRAAGEVAGAYAITPSGLADQGNYSVSFNPGTLTIRGISLMQRVNGELVPVTVSVTPSMVEDFGLDLTGSATPESLEDGMNAKDPNGLMRWENLVTGTSFSQLLLSTGEGVDSTSMSFGLETPAAAGAALGYTVLHELCKLEGGEWRRIVGPSVDASSFSVDLLDGTGNSTGATGLYRVTTLLVPNNELSITNEIPSTNIIGVLEVNSSMTNTMAAVPFTALATDPANPTNMVVADWVQKGPLSGTAQVRAVGADGGYEMWQLKDNAWESFTTIRTSDDGGSTVIDAPEASLRRLPRGGAVWLTRSNVSKPFFLIGQYSPDAVTVTIAAGNGEKLTPTMVANPTFEPVAINELTWSGTPDTGDQILIPSETETPIILTWNGSNWGASELEHYEKNGRMRTRVVRKTDYAIPPGRGFWYYRKATGGLSVTFPAIPND